MKGVFFPYFFVIFTLTDTVLSIDKDYLNLVCDTTVYVGASRLLESSTALFYEPSTACYYSARVDSGKKVMILVRLFELESEVMGACVDFVNFHDGSSTGDATLNPAPICHEDAAGNYTSTGNELTVYFETDATGARRGFDLLIVAISIAPCSTGQFACNNSICIDESLHCNRYDECGDYSDEDGCDYTHLTGTQPNDAAPLIIGLSIGIPVVIICCVLIGYWCWRYHRWRLFVKRPLTAPEVTQDGSTFETTYPVTNVYYKQRYQSLYSNRKPMSSSHVVIRDVTLSEPGSTSTRKPDGDVTGSEHGST